MAKALIGYLPNAVDVRLLNENASLRSRVRELESELTQLRELVATAELLRELNTLTTRESAAV